MEVDFISLVDFTIKILKEEYGENPTTAYMDNLERMKGPLEVAEKWRLIQLIRKEHPAYGVEKGYSWYVGGIKDTGGWSIDHMMEQPLADLYTFYNDIQQRKDSKIWDVWTEGYAATCEHGTATYHGQWQGRTFKEAVGAYMLSQSPEMQKLIDLDRMTFWECRFFNNEVDARKSFG